jgi:hypothetical protein
MNFQFKMGFIFDFYCQKSKKAINFFEQRLGFLLKRYFIPSNRTKKGKIEFFFNKKFFCQINDFFFSNRIIFLGNPTLLSQA